MTKPKVQTRVRNDHSTDITKMPDVKSPIPGKIYSIGQQEYLWNAEYHYRPIPLLSEKKHWFNDDVSDEVYYKVGENLYRKILGWIHEGEAVFFLGSRQDYCTYYRLNHGELVGLILAERVCFYEVNTDD